MKKLFYTAGIFCLGLALAEAQFNPAGLSRAPRISASMSKLFGDHHAFSASVLVEIKSAKGNMTLPGKLALDEGKSRFEMDMSQAQGSSIPADAAAQMKQMGMDKMVVISRPDEKVSYMVYPELKAYLEVPQKEADGSPDDFKVEITELGKEVVDGRPTIKNQAVITGKDGKQHQAIVWNATDLKKFPVKMEQNEEGNQVTMTFKDIQLAKPAAAEFQAPSGMEKYDNMMAMMQQVMMKRMGGMPGLPTPHR